MKAARGLGDGSVHHLAGNTDSFVLRFIIRRDDGYKYDVTLLLQK